MDQLVPEPAASVVAVLNSRAHAVHPDALASAASAAPLLRALGRPDASAASLRRLRHLRSVLLSMVDDGSGRDGLDRDGRGGSERDGPGGSDRDGPGSSERDGSGGWDRDGRGSLGRHGRDWPGRSGWDDFTAATADLRWRQRFVSSSTVELVQTAGDPLVGRLARDVAALVDSGRWSRIRICANQACGAAFYDTTRSRTQRWHSYDTCGNRHNVAAYRARTSS